MKLFIILVFSLLSSVSHAEEVAGFAGLNTTEFDGPGSWDRQFGFEFGASYLHPLQKQLFIRTGAGLAQKSSEADTPVGSYGVDFLLLEVPVTALYRINNQVDVFGGVNFNIMLDDDDVPGSKSIVFNLPLGARINFEGPHSMEAYIELGITDLASSGGSDLSIGNSLGVRYLFTFQK